jgi:hypothetical protein
MIQDSFFVMLNDIYNDLQERNYDGYLILKLSLPLKQLNRLYDQMEVSEIKPIEMLTDEQKNKYWKIAKEFYTDKETAIKASKAAYMLDLISSSF